MRIVSSPITINKLNPPLETFPRRHATRPAHAQVHGDLTAPSEPALDGGWPAALREEDRQTCVTLVKGNRVRDANVQRTATHDGAGECHEDDVAGREPHVDEHALCLYTYKTGKPEHRHLRTRILMIKLTENEGHFSKNVRQWLTVVGRRGGGGKGAGEASGGQRAWLVRTLVLTLR